MELLGGTWLFSKHQGHQKHQNNLGWSFWLTAAAWDFRRVTPLHKVTFGDVLPVDADVLVPVAPGVLVIEAQRVQQLVLDDATVHTAIGRQRDQLPSTVPPHSRPAPGRQGRSSDHWCSLDYSSGYTLILFPASQPCTRLSSSWCFKTTWHKNHYNIQEVRSHLSIV